MWLFTFYTKVSMKSIFILSVALDIIICPGMSISTGVPGFRKTFHTSGKVTTSVGIPGTGLSYVTTENISLPKTNVE